MGSPGYMSPEQRTVNSDDLTPATDLFGLGVVFYELLTTKRPVHLHSGSGSAPIIKPTPPARLRESLDSRVERVCLWMLEVGAGRPVRVAAGRGRTRLVRSLTRA